MSLLIRHLFFAFLVSLIGIGNAGAAVSEEDLRAAYVFNFASLVEWPTKTLPNSTSQLTLCHFGRDDSASERDVTALASLGGRKVNDREIVFKRLSSLAEIKSCQIAVLGEIERVTTARLADALRGAPVVTVAMVRDAATAPEIAIALSVEEGRIVFYANNEYAKRVGLTFSSKLMRLSKKSP